MHEFKNDDLIEAYQEQLFIIDIHGVSQILVTYVISICVSGEKASMLFDADV